MVAASRCSPPQNPAHILAWVLVTLLAASLPAREAGSANLSITPASGAGGKRVTLSASGFDLDGVGYNTGFFTVIGHGQIGACPVDNRANCSIEVNMPAYVPGEFEIEARNSAGESDTDTYNVATPQFSISPACGPAGTTVTAKGKFFAVGTHAALRFDGSYVVTNNLPDSSGNFSKSFLVPGGAGDGSHEVRAQNSVGTNEAQPFTIPCAVIGAVQDVVGPVYRCVANCDAPDVADRTRVPVAPGDPVRQDDRFETDDKARLTMVFGDGTQMTLSERTKLQVDDYVYDPGNNTGSERYEIFAGAFSYVSGLMGKQNDPDHIVETPAGGIGIRGTWFVTRVDEQAGQQEIHLSTGELAVTPDNTGLTSIVNGPVTLVFDADGVTSSAFVDGEADGVADAVDNCALLANSTQCDSDGDGFGNRCDGDLNDNGSTNAQDTVLFRGQLGQPSVAPGYNEADLNCSGAVNAQDTVLFRALLGLPPGPSGLQP